jgi:Family of unknown function (DUF6114)
LPELACRNPMARPIAAGILTVVGGFFILGGGLLFALLGVVFAILGIVSGLFLLGLLVGILTIGMGLLMIFVPSGHTVWGAITVVLAITSILVALGGFIVGFLLALIGGVIAIRWKRPPEAVIVTEGHRVAPPAT